MISIFLFIVFLTFALLYLIIRGKPTKIILKSYSYLDSYEIVDFRSLGRLLTPYRAWKSNDSSNVDFIPIEGTIFYKNGHNLLKWTPTVIVEFEPLYTIAPIGFEFFITNKRKLIEFHPHSPGLMIGNINNGAFSFYLGIRQIEREVNLEQPILFRFTLRAKIRAYKFPFLKCELDFFLSDKFHIGPDLGDIWVGIDLGTSGTCIAAGRSTDNVIMEHEKGVDYISPSLLAFDQSKVFNRIDDETIDPKINLYNVKELSEIRSDNIQSVQSFKKMLGFNQRKKIPLWKNESISLSGTQLTSLLINCIFKDFKKYLENPQNNINNIYKNELLTNGNFSPQRIVVTVPNNFTVSKIQDLIDSFKFDQLNRFKEIRYIYEAEAIILSYLTSYYNDNNVHKRPNPEYLLVFDMGAAMINVTMFIINFFATERIYYNIDTIGKLGYQIGGDSIDYFLLKLLFKGKDIKDITNYDFNPFEIPNLNSVEDILSYNKKKMLSQNLVQHFKMRIIEEFNNPGVNSLMGAFDDLKSFDNNFRINIDDLSAKKYFSDKITLFKESQLNDLLYSKIKQIIREIVALSGLSHIDTVIFTGRSTSFPLIKETVKEELKSLSIDSKNIFYPEFSTINSKTTVARGACLYGINRSAIKFNNRKSNGTFGFTKTIDRKGNFDFFELVPIGRDFVKSSFYGSQINSCSGMVAFKDSFDFDLNRINFYQVMGKDAKSIISNNETDKFELLTSIKIPKDTENISMSIFENDNIDCRVSLIDGTIIMDSTVVKIPGDQSYKEENYNWNT